MEEEGRSKHSVNDSEATQDVERYARLKYGGIMLVAFILALILRWASGSSDFLHIFPALNGKCDSDGHCLGSTAVFRISAALFFFFLVHMMASSPCAFCCGKESHHAMNTTWFSVRVVAFLVITLVMFFIPFSFFIFYGYVALVCGAIFLLMQAMILISFTYDWNDNWMSRSGWTDDYIGEVDPRFARGVVCSTAILYAFCFTMIGLMYHWFLPDTCSSEDKTLHSFFITFTLITGILMSLASAKIPGASILCSGVVFAFMVYTTFSAIMSGSEDSTCNRIYKDSSGVNANTVIQLVIAAAALIYASITAGNSRGAFRLSEQSEESFSFSFFFLCMMMGAGYMAMVLNSWEINKGFSHDEALKVDNSTTSMWVKMASVWVTLLLYIQTLIAPFCCGENGICCKDRVFV